MLGAKEIEGDEIDFPYGHQEQKRESSQEGFPRCRG
jgi:hypothetical protein